jgi:DNA-binding PadR family transcriptional regulator
MPASNESLRVYVLRQAILDCLKEYAPSQMSVEETTEMLSFSKLHPSAGEVEEQWKLLHLKGFIVQTPGQRGKYFRLTEAGVNQLLPSYDQDIFIYGPNALRSN